MDAPPPDDRDVKPAMAGPGLPPKTQFFWRFLAGGGKVSLSEWVGMKQDDQAALAHAGDLVARRQALLLAEEILALAQAPMQDSVETAVASAAASVLAGRR